MMTPLAPKPGVNSLSSRLTVGESWWASNLIRFKDGMMQKLGGWLRRSSFSLLGTCRAILPWADLSGNQYIGCGTSTNLQLWNNGALYDISPLRTSSNLTTPFTTVAGSASISVYSVAHGALVGDSVNITTATAVGGIVLQGWYIIQSITDVDNYVILAAVKALTSGSGAGTVASYATSTGLAAVIVTLTNHGKTYGSGFTVGVSTAVGGLTLVGAYTVASVLGLNSFTITAAATASSDDSQSENSGNVHFQYPIHAELPGYVRNWSLDSWGENLIGCPTGGSIYQWVPPLAAGNNATVVTNSPAANTGLFVSMPAHILVAYGCTDPLSGLQDPMLIRWTTVDDNTVWTATATNQAGSYRIPSGSKIVGAVQAPMQALIFTDTELWSMTYIGFPYVYAFQKVGWGCGLIAQKGVARSGNMYMWMGRKEFYMYDGSQVRILPCPVWNQVYPSLDFLNVDKCLAAVNSEFSEVSFFFPSAGQGPTSPYAFGTLNYGHGVYGGIVLPGATGTATTNENSAYVKFNTKDGVWDYGLLVRTAWADQSILGEPLGVDAAGLIQQHELVADADGLNLPASASTGWMKMAQGGEYVFLERIIPDFVSEEAFTVQMTVNVVDYPGDSIATFGPFDIDNSTQYVVIRARGRLVSIDLNLTAPGASIRMGQFLMIVQPSGRR